MRIWCAHCKRAQEVQISRSRRRRMLQTLAGRVGVCAVCGYPVSVIGTAMGMARHVMPESPLDAPPLQTAQSVP